MEARLYTSLSDLTLVADLGALRPTAFGYGSRLHGGWDMCKITIKGPIAELYQYLWTDSWHGRFFHHLRVTEGPALRWEGRMMSARLITSFGSLEQSVNWAHNKGTYLAASTEGSLRTNTDWPALWPTRDMTIVVPTGTTSGRAENVVDKMLADRVRPQIQGRFALGQGSEPGTLHLTFMGYWSSCHDQRVTVVDYSGGSNTVDSIIKAILTAKCPDISSDQTRIDACAGAINMTLDSRKYPNELIKQVADIGDSSGNSYSFMIYENQVAVLTQITPTVVDWEMSNEGHLFPRSNKVLVRGGGKSAFRAGDVVRVMGLVPPTTDIVDRDGIRTFPVYRVWYDVLGDVLTLTPDSPPNTTSVLLARQGVEPTS